MNTTGKAAVSVAKGRAEDSQPIDLGYGIMGKICPVSATLIDEVSRRVVDPDPPMVMIEEKGREEPNYSDPKYLKALAEAQRLRGVAAMDAMAMFGIELLDGIGDNVSWLNKLKFMHKRGQIDLEGFDFDEPIEREYLFKRYVACTPDVLKMITSVSGMGEEELSAAESSFQGNEAR